MSVVARTVSIFFVEVNVSPDPYPLREVTDVPTCASLPLSRSSVSDYPYASTYGQPMKVDNEDYEREDEEATRGVRPPLIPSPSPSPTPFIAPSRQTCADDGRTVSFSATSDQISEYHTFQIPVKGGCQALSFSLNAQVPSSRLSLYCFPQDASSPITSTNALIGRKVFYTNHVNLFAAVCPEEDAVLECAMHIDREGQYQFIWSSQSTPHRQEISKQFPGSLSMQQGLTAAGAYIYI